mmetsp:Transcript_7261/g.10800  ORF Transcript_7261/g.10800 Transcript_7261/m.10800 type:complete len:231 (-) Transcript_7261:212-904(-)|eukprot:CAMPEP_0185028064 /NCGR_PEP_ID=MMETSP1103-20130426/13546_1 /TAXON_ID=36769 /ORGANISM="Paraphysomonas bandaiensis, Strain Caron Lab Isolate" /LENGTH=230 /DNA_ID=CAMNT_0027562315 /DNA_START=21 /DNA_END=713 /DNA_ORIENTATION=+
MSSEPSDDMNHRTLHQHGFFVLRNQIKVEDCHVETARQLMNKGGVCIFNHNESAYHNDNKRRQKTVRNKDMFGDLIHNIELLFNVEFPSLCRKKTWVVLKSYKGCRHQAAHCDYLPTKEFSECVDELVPLGAVVALEDNTPFHIWRHSVGMSTGKNAKSTIYPRETILLNKSDIIVFRGDLVHSGAGFPNSDNVRLHAYLDSPRVARKRDRTWLVARDAPDSVKKRLAMS